MALPNIHNRTPKIAPALISPSIAGKLVSAAISKATPAPTPKAPFIPYLSCALLAKVTGTKKLSLISSIKPTINSVGGMAPLA